MKLLLDTDAFCKLQVAGLLSEAAKLLGAGMKDCGRLPALPHMLRKGSLRKRYGGATCDSLIPTAKAVPGIPQATDIWLDKLARIYGIDPGEAQLYAAAAEGGFLVLSGDKRALRALKDVQEFVVALARRIVVLEAVLLGLCEHLGPEKVRKRVAPLAAVDTMVRVCFSTGNADPRQALSSYFRRLAAEVKPLVLWDPRCGGGR